MTGRAQLLVVVAGVLLACTLDGCVRIRFDRCREPDPPADCAMIDLGPVEQDGGPDDDRDAGTPGE